MSFHDPGVHSPQQTPVQRREVLAASGVLDNIAREEAATIQEPQVPSTKISDHECDERRVKFSSYSEMRLPGPIDEEGGSKVPPPSLEATALASPLETMLEEAKEANPAQQKEDEAKQIIPSVTNPPISRGPQWGSVPTITPHGTFVSSLLMKCTSLTFHIF